MKTLLLILAVLSLSTQMCCDKANPEVSTVKGIAVPRLKEIELPDHVHINVVHISQNDNYSCATTSVAMAVSHYKGLYSTPLDKEAIWKLSGADFNIIRTKGNDMSALERITKHYGYQSEFAENLTFHDLEFLLSKGILIVINFRPSLIWNNTHAVLVTGYDRSLKSFYVNDPINNSPNTLFSYSDLKSRWSAWLGKPRINSYHSGFIIYPKSIKLKKNTIM